MISKRKKLLHDLKIIAAHLRLRLSNIEILRKAAIAIDNGKRKLLVMNESDRPFFKTIDLQKVEACAVKVEYRSIGAGDLQDRDMDEFIENIHLHISHSEPGMSVKIAFYNARKNTIEELRDMADKANAWRGRISQMLPRRMAISSHLKPSYHEHE